MPKKKRHRGGGGGRGAGRGHDGRQPVGSTGRGIVRRPETIKKSKSGRGRGRGAGGPQRRGDDRQRGKALIGGINKPVAEARGDGFTRHQEIVKAHAEAIMAIAMTPECIYTCSRDKKLKRWKTSRNSFGRFELTADLEVPFDAHCLCMAMAGEWIFCGLGSGDIMAFSKSGQQAKLAGHTKRANCLLVHENVLISGGSDGIVRCWQADPATGTFACTHTISEGISGATTCMAVLNGYLWVGGSSGISVVELASLRVVHELKPNKFVSAFQQFQNHMIVAYADGSVHIFDATGVEKLKQQPLECGPILCIAGLDSGPRLLCGHAKGQVSSVILPEFTLKLAWQVLERCKVQSISCAGQDGFFLIGAENGNLQVWQRDDGADL